MSQDVEEMMKRIITHKGVKALIIINREGHLLKTNMEMNASTEQLIQNIHELVIAARRLVRDVDPHDDLLFLRTQSDTEELLISPDVTFTVVVIQEQLENIRATSMSVEQQPSIV